MDPKILGNFSVKNTTMSHLTADFTSGYHIMGVSNCHENVSL